MRRAARRDSNELELIAAAQKIGAFTLCMGPLDWWINWRGHWVPTEIKAKNGHYTDFQKKFLALCKEKGFPVWVWRTVDDVEKCLTR